MKKALLSIAFSFIIVNILAQKPILYDSLAYTDSNWVVHQTPRTFDLSDSADREYFLIDTTQANNIWQYAKVNKPGFANTNSIVLTTDSVQNYPINNESSFMFKLKYSSNGGGIFSLGITLHHKYRTDSLNDGLTLEYLDRYSQTWKPGRDMFSEYLYFVGDSSYNWDGFFDGDLLGGRVDSLQYARLAFGSAVVKGGVDSLILRFTFRSDSIDTHKPGWMIDKIMIEQNFFSIGSVHECNLAQDSYLAYFDGDRLIVNSLLQENRQSDFTLFDMLGREIIIDEVHYGLNSIDVTNLPSGYYIVKVKNQAGVYTKKLFIGD